MKKNQKKKIARIVKNGDNLFHVDFGIACVSVFLCFTCNQMTP